MERRSAVWVVILAVAVLTACGGTRSKDPEDVAVGDLLDVPVGELPAGDSGLRPKDGGAETAAVDSEGSDSGTPDVCTPHCEGKECGDDGCGGSCGDCAVGYECVAGACEESECVPDCIVVEDDEEYLSECGTPDGCGGTCDECEPDDVCALADYAEIGICFNPDEVCPEVCESEGVECGGVWAGFVWPDCECGECPEGKVCNAQGTCE